MASMFVSASTAVVVPWAPPLLPPSLSSSSSSSFASSSSLRCGGVRRRSHVVRMAPRGQRIIQRTPLDIPIEWERAKPARRPDIFPNFGPIRIPLPIPEPFDPLVEVEGEEFEEEEFEEGYEERENRDLVENADAENQ